MALSVSYWSPMEKLILHLSPVARRRTLKNNNGKNGINGNGNGNLRNATGSLGRIPRRSRTRSEPNGHMEPHNPRSASLKSVNGYFVSNGLEAETSARPPASNGSSSLESDVKTLRTYAIHQVESELIDKLDILVSENKGDDDYKNLFSAILVENLTQKNPVWRENGKSFVESVTKLLERLLDYRNVGQGDENRDKRMSCTVNLLNFYRSEKNRKEMYLRYIYKLHDLHLPAGSLTEAAFTLKLHADDLEWSNRPLHSDLRYPSQKEWQRKEQLYLKIIEYFEKDKQWEDAIPLCKELAVLYEKKVFDYVKLASILKRTASLFEKIISSDEEGLRFDPEYFRVGFYGQGFPLFLRNKEFVYRGQEWEKISTFTQRLASEFPHAQVLTSNSKEPDAALRSEDGQYVQICCIKPVSSLNNKTANNTETTTESPMEGYEMPERIKKFYAVNNVDEFQYDRPFYKGQKDKDNEFKTLWIERTTYHIESKLPGILRWFEVVKKDSVEISPIEHASETVAAKNAELRDLMSNPRPVLKLTQSLQGVIDAAVNGGLAKYQEAFFNNAELASHHPDQVAKLQALMSEQVSVLETALDTHKKVASADLLPLHTHLVERFATMKQNVTTSAAVIVASNSAAAASKKTSIVNTPLPPVPSPPSAPMPPASMPSASATSASLRTASSSVTLASEDSLSTASSATSPTYGQLQTEAIYSKPADLKSSGSASHSVMTTSCPPPSFAHWSKFDTASSVSGSSWSPPPPRPPSLRMRSYRENAHHHHHFNHHHRDSGIHVSIGSSEDVSGSAPPLPPRSSYGSMSFSSQRSSLGGQRLSTFSTFEASSSVTTSEPPTPPKKAPPLSPRGGGKEDAPPPIPPKATASPRPGSAAGSTSTSTASATSGTSATTAVESSVNKNVNGSGGGSQV